MQRMVSLARGYSKLHRIGLLDQSMGIRSPIQLAEHVANGVFGYCSTYDTPIKVARYKIQPFDFARYPLLGSC